MQQLQLRAITTASDSPTPGFGRNINALAVRSHPSASSIRGVLAARARRAQFFSAKLFADPAWDMLLVLYVAEQEHSRLSVGKLCEASRVPDTTGLRWIATLEKEGLIQRRGDPLDSRRVFVSLSQCGLSALRAYFETMQSPAEGLYSTRPKHSGANTTVY